MDNEVSVPNVSSPPPLPPRPQLPSTVSSQIKDSNVSVPAIPPPLPRKVPGGLGDYSQADDSLLLFNLEDADENELNEKQLRELYDNEEIDRFLTLFSDVCNTSRVFKQN